MTNASSLPTQTAGLRGTMTQAPSHCFSWGQMRAHTSGKFDVSMNFRGRPHKVALQEQGCGYVVMQGATLGARRMVAVQTALRLLDGGFRRIGLRHLVEVGHAAPDPASAA